MQGLGRLNKVLCLFDLVDHPKDFVFISDFASKFFTSYAKNDLFPQTFNLLQSTTNPECMLEVAKILERMYNSLKFSNHIFNFREFLEKEKVISLFFSQDSLKGLLDITCKTSNQLFEVFVLILVNIVKYTDKETIDICDSDYLTAIFMKLETEMNADSYSALALLAYSLSLKHILINDNATVIDVLTRTGIKLMSMESAELFVYGLRIYSLLLKYNLPGTDFIQIFTKLEPILR